MKLGREEGKVAFTTPENPEPKPYKKNSHCTKDHDSVQRALIA